METINNFFCHSRQIIHCGHHKCGSSWIAKVLLQISSKYGIKMSMLPHYSMQADYYDSVILYDNHSDVILGDNDYIGTHLIRDPRDIIISGYFYHLWSSDESEVEYDAPLDIKYRYNNKSLSFDDGLIFEMKNVSLVTILKMNKWDYNNPKFLELKYEDLISNSDDMFIKMFNYWGINPIYIDECLKISREHHMTSKTGRKVGEEDSKSHMRNGLPGQWKMYFTDKHKSYFKDQFGDILIKLGYEKNNDW